MAIVVAKCATSPLQQQPVKRPKLEVSFAIQGLQRVLGAGAAPDRKGKLRYLSWFILSRWYSYRLSYSILTIVKVYYFSQLL
jgi:hypothetical protein